MSKWNGKKFSVFTSDEKSTLGLVKELGEQTNYNTDEIEQVKISDSKKVSRQEMQDNYKIDEQGNFTGTWCGINKPTHSDIGLQGTVEKMNEVIIPSLQTKVSDIELNKASKEDIARISSGTPLFVDSVSEMTDTTRNYVNLTDMFVYIYTGDRWEKTNIKYQGNGISKNSVQPTMLLNGVEYNNLYNYYNNCIDGYFINAKGEIVANENGSYAKIPVTPQTKISILKPSGKYQIESGAILFINSSGNKVDYINGNTFINGKYNNYNYITVTIPPGVSHILFNVKLSDYDNRYSTIVELGENITISENQITKMFGKKIKDEILNKLFNDFVNTIKLTGKNLYNYVNDFIPNKLSNTNGIIQSADGWGVAQIKAKGNTTYSLYIPNGDYSTNIGTISFYKKTSLLEFIVGSEYINGKCNDVNYITFTTPKDTDLIYVTCKRPIVPIFDNSQTLKIFESNYIDDNVFGEYLVGLNGHNIKNYDGEISHPLKGLKWGFIGDSLTNKNSRALKNYIDYIVEETGIIGINLGVSGTGYKKTEESNNAFYQRVENIDNDFDIITIFGSGNDLSLNLGNITDSDTSTVFGCVNETIKKIYAKMPTVKLGIISPTPWIGYPNYLEGNKMQLLNEGLEKICKRGSIPFLDLYNGSNLRPWDATFRTLMYSRDDGNGVHPDENGHKRIYRKILQFGERM